MIVVSWCMRMLMPHSIFCLFLMQCSGASGCSPSIHCKTRSEWSWEEGYVLTLAYHLQASMIWWPAQAVQRLGLFTRPTKNIFQILWMAVFSQHLWKHRLSSYNTMYPFWQCTWCTYFLIVPPLHVIFIKVVYKHSVDKCEICETRYVTLICTSCQGKTCTALDCRESCAVCGNQVCKCCIDEGLRCKSCEKIYCTDHLTNHDCRVWLDLVRIRNGRLDKPQGHVMVQCTAPDGYIVCQLCHSTVPRDRAIKACYQCAYNGMPGFACDTCGPFVECPDCLGTFCGEHIDPYIHVRQCGRNILDTCAKRTRVLNRIIDQRNYTKVT